MNLGARLDQKCLTQCPTNSYPMLKYDGASAQERTQFDPSKADACQKYSYHLQFTKQSSGLPLPGPPDFRSTPDEFNIAFWLMPTDLNSKSFFLNMFNRAQIWAESANGRLFYRFITGPMDADFVKPVDPGDVNNQKIQLSNWNYVSVS